MAAMGQPVIVASLERQKVGVEKDIREACSEFLNEPDWEKNMKIVDSLNSSPFLCPFAIKEIRLRLKTKNPEIEILALQLTETLIKNCPSSHAAVAQEDFMRYLVKVGTDQRQGGKWTQLKTKMKKKDKSINSKHIRSQCIEKALLILKMLAIAYMDSGLYPVFRATYKQLEAQNVRFPETNKDESLNVFSPMHSSNAPDEFAKNSNLPMIRPFVPLKNIQDPVLVQAQEQAQLLWQMVNAPVLSYELIPDLTTMLNMSQQQIVVMISEGNAAEETLVAALEVNDVLNVVLEDAQCIVDGTKRRYQQEVDIKKVVDDDEDNVSLEHSISINDEQQDHDKQDLLVLAAPSNKDKTAKKRASKKEKRQSLDLLGMDSMDDQKNNNSKKEESEENILDFLGMDHSEKKEEAKKKPKVVESTVFDPLQEMDSENKGNKIESGNASVLNVLTGASNQDQTGDAPKQRPKNDAFDTGTDPFADFGGNAFDDLGDEQQQKQVINKNDNDIFAGIGGNEPAKSKEPEIKPSKPQIPHKKQQDSDILILDMFASGASPDPNSAKKEDEAETESNPFDALSNPFGSSGNVQDNNDGNKENKQSKNNKNPFDELENPFGADKADKNKEKEEDEENPFDADNPFSANAVKKEDFMGDMDPFEDVAGYVD